MKTAAAIVVAGVLCAFAGQILAVATQPIMATYQTGRDIQKLENVLAKEKATNATLRADIAHLGTDAGVEQEARRRGWVMPGEVALTIVVPQEADAAGAADKPQAEQAPKPFADRIRDAVATTLAVFGGHAPKSVE